LTSPRQSAVLSLRRMVVRSSARSFRLIFRVSGRSYRDKSGMSVNLQRSMGRRVTRDAADARRQNTTTTRIATQMTFADGALTPSTTRISVELDATFFRSHRKLGVQSPGINCRKRHTLRAGDGDMLHTEDRRPLFILYTYINGHSWIIDGRACVLQEPDANRT